MFDGVGWRVLQGFSTQCLELDNGETRRTTVLKMLQRLKVFFNGITTKHLPDLLLCTTSTPRLDASPCQHIWERKTQYARIKSTRHKVWFWFDRLWTCEHGQTRICRTPWNQRAQITRNFTRTAMFWCSHPGVENSLSVNNWSREYRLELS